MPLLPYTGDLLLLNVIGCILMHGIQSERRANLPCNFNCRG